MSDQINDIKAFTTRDLYLASVLVLNKYEMLPITFQIEGSRTVGYFSFPESEELKEVARKFSQGLLTVEPRAYITAMRSIKSLISNFTKSPFSTHQGVNAPQELDNTQNTPT